ncbi:putative plasma membrane fusion protein prm1 protein [Zalerion maritima]|uniref:Plasma membrane fusion protein PRM1 n=1 Tax=Zalerion maritima TaxID=339359 RepID=A0AAD5RIG3_9PEZI|nr:putative plasma membrane fusion protein prm1 protein [Zalerion maritima]
MFFSRKRKEEEYPDLPGSLNADPYYDDPNSPTSPATKVATPYVGWWGRMSQLPINRWTVLIILVLIRVLIMLAGLNDDIGTSKEKALSACAKVEDVGSAMASMPHYLSLGVNDLAASGITNAVGGLVSGLEMILTAILEIILFIINLVTGTYVCLISAFIHGGLDAAKSAIEGATDLLNNAVDSIANGIDDEVASFQDKLNDFTDVINDLAGGIGSIFGGDVPDIPSLDLSDDIEGLKNVDIDTSSLTSGLDDLNDSIPDFQDVRNLTRQAVSIPFNFVQEKIEEAWGNYSFDRDVFPLADKEALTFCSDNTRINDFFESLYDLATHAKLIFIVTLVIAAVLAMIAMIPLEKHRWERQKELSKLVHNSGFNPLDVVYITSRPTSSRIGIWMGEKIASGRRSILVRWAWAYGTTLPALFLLSLAIAGFFSCLCQYFVLMGIQKKVPELAEQVGDFAEDVVVQLQDVSVRWATDANGVITDFNDDINNDVFGYVTNATDAVNDTLNTFVTEMNDGLDAVFKDTILYEPIKDVIYCLVTVKVEGIQKGITWVHDHAHIDFPLFSNNTFSLGAADSIDDDSDLKSFLASPSSTTTDEITEAAQTIADHIRNNIVTELLISTGILLTYIIVVLIGVVVAAGRILQPNHGEDGTGFVTTTSQEHANHAPPCARSVQGARSVSDMGAHTQDSNPYKDEKAGHYRGQGSSRNAYGDQYGQMHDIKL